jgi:hypothetical protein
MLKDLIMSMHLGSVLLIQILNRNSTELKKMLLQKAQHNEPKKRSKYSFIEVICKKSGELRCHNTMHNKKIN